MYQKKEIIGSYTTYYRSQMEPCLVDADKYDLRNMELLGFSKINPLYLVTKAILLRKRKSRTIPEPSSLVNRLANPPINSDHNVTSTRF